MNDDGQNPSVIETSEISAEPSNGGKISFRKHHANLDAFVVECNQLLADRGLHACEAFVHATWKGEAILTRVEMTAQGLLPMGATLDLPWVMPTAKRQITNIILTDALEKLDLCARDACAKNGGILRHGFEVVARRTERILIPTDVGR